METIPAFTAKTKFSELLDRVERGEELTITRHGEPVAKIVPIEKPNPQRVREAIERWIAYRDQRDLSSGGLTLKQLRDEGRR